MEYISATEARNDFSAMLDKVRKGPVVIQRQNRDAAVLISPENYQKLRAIRLKELDDLCARASAYAKSQGLTEEKLAELLADES